MLRTRLWMGAVLIALTVAALVADRPPAYPVLFLLVQVLAGAACYELRHLLPAAQRPPAWLAHASVFAVIAANWAPLVVPGWRTADAWHAVLGAYTATVLAGFLVEMARFRQPGGSIARIATVCWMTAYLGLLTSFLVQLRWQPAVPGQTTDAGVVALLLTVFVPKCGDTGAYFTGRLIGRHPMTPVLSPKKTWEGAAGALIVSALAAVALDRLGPILPSVAAEVGFGLTVGLAGLLGDLAESLIKRDCEQKDASQVVPGFGGVLDVVDAIVFAAPVAYCWLRVGQLAAPALARSAMG